MNKTYVAELEQLMKKAMDSGNLEGANAIQDVIGKITPDPFKAGKPKQEAKAPAVSPDSKENPMAALIGKWKRVGSGTKYDGDLIEFTSEKKGSYNGKEPFVIRYSGVNKTITIDNGVWKNRITPTDDPDVLDAVTDSGMTYRLVRLK